MQSKFFNFFAKYKIYIMHVLVWAAYTSMAFGLSFTFTTDIFFQFLLGMNFFLFALFMHGAILYMYERFNLVWRIIIIKRLQEHMQKQLAEIQGKIMIMREVVADAKSMSFGKNVAPLLHGDEEKIMNICDVDLWKPDDGNLVWILQRALEEDSLQVYIQPIVTLPQRRRCFFECYSWIHAQDGKTILPRFYEPIARDLGFLTQIHHSMLKKSFILLQQLHQHDSTLAFSCNIHSLAFKAPYFWKEFIVQFSKISSLCGKLMIELDAEDFMANHDFLLEVMQEAKKNGLLFAIENPKPEIVIDNFSFVKCTAEYLLSFDRWPIWNVPVIATKIERDEQLLDLLDLGISYGQGFLLGEPRLSKLQPLEGMCNI